MRRARANCPAPTFTPTAAVSGWYFAHPEASYFGIGRVERDQLLRYAEHTGVSVEDAARLLSPVLADDANRPGKDESKEAA